MIRGGSVIGRRGIQTVSSLGLSSGFPRAGGNFSPDQLSGLNWWIKADSGVYADGATQFTRAQTEYLSINSNSSLQIGDTSFTWAGWVYFDTVGVAQYMVAKYSSGNTGDYSIALNSSSKIFFNIYDGSTSQGVTHGATLTTGTWYFVHAYFDNANNLLSVNVNQGTPVTATGTVVPTASAQPLSFGRRGAGDHLDGRMDSWGFWKRILTASEVTSLYNAGAGRVYSDLTTSDKVSMVSFYNLDENGQGTRYDSHGTNHLLPSGTAFISTTLLNGGFETAGAGGADAFATWSENPQGSSTVTRDTTTFDSGVASALFTIDGSNSYADVNQSVVTGGKGFSYSLRAKAASGAPTIQVGGSLTQVQHTLTTSWATYTGQFVPVNAIFLIKRLTATGLSFNIDGVTLTSLGPTSASSGIAAGVAKDGGYAAQFVASNTEYLSSSNTAFQAGDVDISFSVWALMDSKSATSIATVLSKWGGTSATREYRLRYDSGNARWEFTLGNSGSTGSATNAASANLDTWTHLVCTYNATTDLMSLYVNAGTPGTATFAGPVNAGATDFQIGALNGTSSWDGGIALFGIWKNRVLSAADATQLFNNGMGLRYADLDSALAVSLVEYANLDELSGNRTGNFAGLVLTDNNTVTFRQGPNYSLGVAAKVLDQSSSAYNLTQTTSSARPGWKASGINGKPTFVFDAVDDFWSASTATNIARNLAGLTFFVVGKSTSGVLSQAFFIGTAPGLNRVFYQHTAGGNISIGGRRLDADSSQNSTASGYTSNVYQISSAAFDYANAQVSLYKNGTALVSAAAFQTAGSTENTASNKVLVGSADGSNFWSGEISELIFYNRKLSDVERRQVEAYLSNKYAIGVA